MIVKSRSFGGVGLCDESTLPIVTFDEPDRGKSKSARPDDASKREPFRAKLVASTERFDRFLPAFALLFGSRKIGLLASMLLCPYAGLEYLSNRIQTSTSVRILAMILAVLTFSPRFLASYLRHGIRETFHPKLAPASANSPSPAPALIESDELLEPLDSWEAQVLDYARKMERLDVVHAHDLPSLRVAIEIKKLRGVPVIYDAHELYSYQELVFDAAGRRRAFRAEKAMLADVDHIVTVTDMQAEIMKFDFGPGDYATITNATETPSGFDPNRKYDLIREKTGIPAGDKILLFQGTLGHSRYHHLLLDGLAMARGDVHIAFLTWGHEIVEFREMAKNLGIADRVHFLPPVPYDAVVFWAASADAGMMPYQASNVNTLISGPNKMFEFIAAAVPMIVSTCLLNASRLIESEGFGVTRTLRVAEDYAAAIDEMFDESLGGAGRFRRNLLEKRDQHLWRSEKRNLVRLYERAETRRNLGAAGERKLERRAS